MNETLKKILAMIPDDKKSDAKTLGDTLQGVLDTNETNLSKFESQKSEAIKSRDALKSQLKDIGKKLGIDLDADDVTSAIEAIKNKKGLDKSEALEAMVKEKEALQTEIDSLTEKLETQKTEHTTEMLHTIFQKDFAEIAPKYKAVPKLMKFLGQELSDKAVFEDGKVSFKNEDGTTLRINNEDATMDTLLSQMRNAEIESKESLYFDISAGQSGPGSNRAGPSSEEDFVPGSSS